MVVYKFQPRYTKLDTSTASPGFSKFSIWCCIVSSFRIGCSTKIRAFISTIILLALWIAMRNLSSIFEMVENQSPVQAHRQSYGYIDLPKWKWKSQREYYKKVHSTPISLQLPASEVGVPRWYESNIKVDFDCPEQYQLTDYWWICNPKHLNSKRGCTIYSSGPPDDNLAVEHALEELLPSCSIHHFDPLSDMNSTDKETSRVQFHPWGFAESARKGSNSQNATFDLDTIKGTMKKLSHSHVDLLLLYCNGCEWTVYFANVQQVIVVVKGVQSVEWFTNMNKKNYVLFHKELIDVSGISGTHHVLSYFKLRRAFFS